MIVRRERKDQEKNAWGEKKVSRWRRKNEKEYKCERYAKINWLDHEQQEELKGWNE